VLVDRGRAGQAIPILERALAIREHRAVARELLAETRDVLARALWRSTRDRERAIALARQARDGYAAGGGLWQPRLVALDAWLRQVHPENTR
jgi:eukaryotic-like serine/threonine-protein kinase